MPIRPRRAAGAASDPDFPALKARIIARTGHHYYVDKDDLLFDRVLKRFRALGLTDARAYAERLDGPGSDAEWAAIEAEITIGETFFFRYAEQFSALRQTILPGLIETRAGERRLRIWSAGCSTGAEPYSVAILLQELLGSSLGDWNISITGTDISLAALATAREAEYGRWALRTMPLEDRLRWFLPTAPRAGSTREGGFRLKPEFRAMVRFEQQNLIGLTDGTVPPSFAGYDLILCRNVLIYFSADTVFRIVRSFGDRLRASGWLLIGHAEPNPAFAGWLSPINLPGTVAYRRHDEPALLIEKTPTTAESLSAAVPTEITTPEGLPALASIPIAGSEPEPAGFEPSTETAVPTATSLPPKPESRLEQVRALANSGATGEAWRLLRDAIDAEPTDPVFRFFEGLLALDLGRQADAEKAFRGVLFLDRDFVMAHYHLGLLLISRGRRKLGRRALDNALRLAQGLPDAFALAEGDGVTAAEMVENIRQTLRASS